MKSNVEVNFEINAEDMEILKNFNKIESYGESGIFRYTAERRKEDWQMEEKKNAWGKTNSIPINEKYMLSIREASDYFGIGIKNMRRLAENNTNNFALYFGNRYLIVRHLFEAYIMECPNNGGMEEVCECEDQE